MRRKDVSRAALIAALSSVAMSGCAPRFPTTGWPIDNTGTEHEIGNSAGEFQQYTGSPYFHRGLDILDQDAPTGPWVRNTRDGTVTFSTLSAGSLYNGMTLTTSDGDTYLYWHLDFQSIQLPVQVAANAGTTVTAGSQIAQLVTWTACNYHHLHYQVSDSSGTLDPIFTLTPRNDTTDPILGNLYFTENASSNQFPTSPGTTTPVLSGDVDVIVHAFDFQFGNASTGVMELSYRVNDPSNGGVLVKSPTTIRFDDIPADSNAGTIYRLIPPFVSTSDYCATEYNYYVLTNVDNNGNIISDASGFWDTTTLSNGTYEVSVTIEDSSRNDFTFVRQVEIAN